MTARALLILVVTGLLSAADARAATWVEARSPHFTVYSDAGEKQARRAAWQFEQIRESLVRLWPWATSELGAPVIVYAARDEHSMRALVPSYYEGRNAVRPTSVFYSVDYGHYITLRLDAGTRGEPNVNPFINSYWSYVALVLRTNIPQELPPWMFRGMAEVFSNTIVGDDAILVGPVIPWHLQTLRSHARPALSELLGADRSSPYLTNGDRLEVFDASAWALVHFLMFGNEGKHIPVFNHFADAVRLGGRPNELVMTEYGGETALRNGLARYIDQSLFVYQKWQTAVAVDGSRFPVRTLPAADAAVVLARLHAVTGRPAEARAQLATAGDTPAAAEVEGLLLDREKKFDDAKRAYARASEAGAATHYGEYRLASLSWPRGDAATPEDFEPIVGLLRRSVERYPSYAPAYRLLADALVRLDRGTEALGAAQRAVTIAPRDPYSHLSLARAYWSLSKAAEATAAANKSLSLASSEAETGSARQFLEFLAKSPTRQAVQLAASTGKALSAEDVKRLYSECYRGDDDACARLVPMFEEACAAGREQGCVMMGFLYVEGRGVAKDHAKARTVLQPLCDRGTQEACRILNTIK